jgi:uncharacterized cupin superfamily protein
MTKVINEHSVSYVERNLGQKEYAWHTSEKLTDFLGAHKVRMDVRSLDPGAFSFPYHFHHDAEELFVVLSGEMTLRKPEGLVVLHAGDVVFCEVGATGAHQFRNHSDAPCRYLDLVTVSSFDAAEYPDTGKIMNAKTRELYRKGESVGYLDGEQGVADLWSRLPSAE